MIFNLGKNLSKGSRNFYIYILGKFISSLIICAFPSNYMCQNVLKQYTIIYHNLKHIYTVLQFNVIDLFVTGA